MSALCRRDVLRALGALALAACGGNPAVPPPAAQLPLAIGPLADLVPAAGLGWVVLLEPRALAALRPHIHKLFPAPRFALFAARHGGVDPRELDELVLGAYPESTLVLARGTLDPARIEAAFAARAVRIDSRVLDRAGGPDRAIVRLTGNVGGAKEQLVLFGRGAAGLELGDRGLSRLRAAELFLLGRLRRASPAFRSPPLDLCASALGPAPARVFFPGPFTGDAAEGLGGLLRGATSVGVSATPAHANTVAIQCVVLGVEGRDSNAAQARLLATYDTLAASGLGRLCGLDHPQKTPTVSYIDPSLRLEVELDAARIAVGLHEATEATLQELLRA